MAATTAQRESTREAILQATDRVMARYGFRKMTMDDLAKEAGVSKRTIYLYFSSKEDVGLSSIGHVVEQVHAELEEIAASSLSATDRLRKMLERRALGRVERIQDYATSLDELFEAVRPAYLARRSAYFDRERALLAKVIREGVAAGEMAADDPEAAAEAMLLATNAFLPYSLSVRELGTLPKLRKRLVGLIDLLARGISSQQAKEPRT